MGPDLRIGDAPGFTRAVQRLAGDSGVFVQLQSATTAKAQQALRPYAGALDAFAGALALTAFLVLGQALSRHLAALGADVPTLAAMAMSRRQLISPAGLRAAAVGIGASLVAIAVAVAVSSVMPIGPAHDFEPSPGLSVDGLVLPAGAAIMILLTVAFGLWTGWRGHPGTVPTRLARTERLAARFRPTRAMGIRMAMDRGRGDSAAASRTTLATAVLGAAAVTAALTFGASLDHFLATPRLYGWDWDAQVDLYDDFVPQLDAMRSAPEVLDASMGTYGLVTIDGAAVPAIGVGDGTRRAGLHPPLVAGRTAETAGEIVLGTGTLRRIGRAVGDRVTVTVGQVRRSLRIVGRATFSRFAPYRSPTRRGWAWVPS